MEVKREISDLEINVGTQNACRTLLVQERPREAFQKVYVLCVGYNNEYQGWYSILCSVVRGLSRRYAQLLLVDMDLDNDAVLLLSQQLREMLSVE